MNEYVRKAVLTVPQTAIFSLLSFKNERLFKKGLGSLDGTSDCSILRVLPPPSIIRS